MGYKLLGFAVWQGGKWYVRRRFTDTKRRVVIAGIGGLLLTAAFAAQRAANSQ